MTGTAKIDSSVEAALPAKWRNPFRAVLAYTGILTIGLARQIVSLSAMAAAVLWQSLRPLNWRRTLAKEFLRQFRLVGFGALSFVLLTGMLIGVAMVFQFLYWLALAGQRGMIGEIIVLIMVREVAPLLVALIVIGKSGSVNMIELDAMRSKGQIHALDARGIDPFLFIVLPRCLATAVSMFCLTVAFILTALVTGYLVGEIAGAADSSPLEFLNDILVAMGVGEYAIVVLKPLLAGLFITLVTCNVGLSERARDVGTANVLPVGFLKSVLAVFLVSGALSMLL